MVISGGTGERGRGSVPEVILRCYRISMSDCVREREGETGRDRDKQT